MNLVVREGNPAHVLLESSAGAMMLVVGSRGRGGFAGLILGSVSAAVAEHASCPVLVVHGDKPVPSYDLLIIGACPAGRHSTEASPPRRFGRRQQIVDAYGRLCCGNTHRRATLKVRIRASFDPSRRRFP
jgi:hypothetical protein